MPEALPEKVMDGRVSGKIPRTFRNLFRSKMNSQDSREFVDYVASYVAAATYNKKEKRVISTKEISQRYNRALTFALQNLKDENVVLLSILVIRFMGQWGCMLESTVGTVASKEYVRRYKEIIQNHDTFEIVRLRANKRAAELNIVRGNAFYPKQIIFKKTT